MVNFVENSSSSGVSSKHFRNKELSGGSEAWHAFHKKPSQDIS